MFYEFSLQYDDPIIIFSGTTPFNDIVHYKVNQAFPNWIPPNYPRLQHTQPDKNNNDNDNIPTTDFTLQYHKLVHLSHIYFNSMTPTTQQSNNLKYSISNSIVNLLTPLVSRANWTQGDLPPSPNEFFYRSFPKQSTDLDNDYHNRNPGIFWGWFYLARWLPNLIQKVLFPLDNVAYADQNEIHSSNNISTTSPVTTNTSVVSANKTCNARKLHGKQIPTKVECQSCERFKGLKIWNKKGDWYCIYANEVENLDHNSYFNSFNEYINWKAEFDANLLELEKKAFSSKNMEEMSKIEDEINDLKFKNLENLLIIKSNCIVSIKG